MRTFPNTLVLHLDAVPDDQGETFDPNGLCFVPECYVSKSPGSNALEDIIGFAKLHIGADKNLYADITILNFVEGPLKLFPSVVGSVLERNGTVLSQTVVKGLGLTTSPNTDKRIPAIDIPALEKRVDPFDSDTWDGPPTKVVLPMCKERFPEPKLFEQPGEELNPK
jgi:hypothetical protein